MSRVFWTNTENHGIESPLILKIIIGASIEIAILYRTAATIWNFDKSAVFDD